LKPITKKKALEEAKSHYENCARVMRAHEIKWNDMWEAQPNPFLRIKEYTSAKQTAMRKPIIDAWLQAKKDYETLARARSFNRAQTD
jgi:hypothetical protein